jgi:stage III sporulation protein AH
MKSKIIGKKQLLSFSLIFALGLSVYVNWYYTNNYNDITEPETSESFNLGEAQLVNSNNITDNTSDYFIKAKVNRTKAHDEAIQNLEEIIKNKDLDEDTITLARTKLVNISEQIKTETDIENIIKAQLDEENLVTLNEDDIQIVMPNGSVNDKSILKIRDVVFAKTKLSADKIVIIELK